MKPEQVFADNKNLKEFHQTSDGNKFYDPLVAKSHAKGLKDKTVTPFLRKDHVGKKKQKEVKLSAEDRIKAVQVLETVEAVEAYVAKEDAKTVLAAAAERIEKLNADKGAE